MRTKEEYLKSIGAVNTTNKFDETFSRTNFTPKKKPSLFTRLKKSVNNFFKKVRNTKTVKFIFNWWSNNVTKPYQDYKKDREHKKYVKKLKKGFSEMFNVDVEKTINIMKGSDYNPSTFDKNQLLVENRLEINKIKSILGNKMAPFIQDLEIVDIHNENLNPENLPLNEIISNEHNKASQSLKDQESFYKNKNKLKSKSYF
jgi:hypothetical protein